MSRRPILGPTLPCYQNQTLQRKEKKSRPNQIQQYIKRLIPCDQVEFIPGMQGWYNIQDQLMEFTIFTSSKRNLKFISIDSERHLTKFNIHS